MVVPSSPSNPAFPAETAVLVFENFERLQRAYRIDIASWFLLTSVYSRLEPDHVGVDAC